ncbi:Glycinol 4-dimethylallyltransferase [Glycine max]|nr:Glycinol 4-dimethylallyltransferase [Glycine max]
MDSGSVISSTSACSITTGSCASKASKYKKKTQIECNILRSQQSSLNHHYKRIEGGATYQDCDKKYVVKAIPEPTFDSEPCASNPENVVDSAKKILDVFYHFCYPYSMIAIILCAISSSLLAVEKPSDISSSFLIGVLQALVPHLFVAVFANVVNQVFDYEIDKINKPYLPLASGQLSFTTAVFIAASLLIMSFWLSLVIGSWPLIWNVVLTSSVWNVYSINVPLLRWKRHPLLATICTISVWAFILPITFFLHMQTFVLKRPIVFPRSLIFYVVFMIFYSLGMALSKDISDVKGDKAYGIDTLAIRLGQKWEQHLLTFGLKLSRISDVERDKIYGIDTFSIRLGQKRVFWICVFLFEMGFGVALLTGASSS